MKLSKILFITIMVFVIMLSAAISVFAQHTVEIALSASNSYNRFFVADLGFTGFTKNVLFTVKFSRDDNETDKYYVAITIEDDISGQTLLTGTTTPKPYYPTFSGVTYNNINITNASNLGGTFRIIGGGASKELEDKILATGALPQSRFKITIALFNSNNPKKSESSDSITITINPPYQQPLYPLNIAVSKSGLDFRWISNFKNIELHLFKDPNGNKELLAGSILPKTNLGRAQGVDGSDIAGLLEEGRTYYWQLWGYITTSHGDELVKGTLNEFVYSQEGTASIDLVLSEPDKQEIKKELSRILAELFGKKWARNLRNYDIARILLDEGFISREEVMTILHLIEQKKLDVNNIYLK